MTTLMKIFCTLFGYDYETVLRQPTASRQKIVTLGLLILIPVILWAFSGFYLAHFLLGLGYIASAIVALTLGGIILAVDRSFVATPKTGRTLGLIVLRFGFAVVSTVLGSVALDLALFQGDLAEYRQALLSESRSHEEEAYKADHSAELTRLEQLLPVLQARETSLGDAHILEMTGKGGSGKTGKGKISDAIEHQKVETAKEAARVEEALGAERTRLDEAAKAHAEQKLTKRQDALLSQLKDLHGFVFSDGYAIAIYFFFFAFVAMLEVFFILYKSFTSDTIFEDWLEAEESYGKQKLEAYRRRKAQVAREYGALGEDYAQVRQLLGETPTRRII
ncbi:DUF4407 domain-containing protein [Algoriphagus sp.]|uniref:DUF4407 domain-containing protein n=1 Tax=Algoriphagus sp. TaxID=1872435 RepID=UPI003919DE2E